MSMLQKRRSLNVSFETLDSRTMSLNSLESLSSRPPTLKDEIETIKQSLDSIKNNLLSQQLEITRDFEERVRNTYDGVINDLNEVRKKVNTIGDDFSADTKFKTWVPSAPFRKEVLQNIYEIRKPSKLTISKSVDFVDSCEKDKSNMDQTNHASRGFVGQGRFSSGKLKKTSSSDLHRSHDSASRSILNSRANSTASLHRQISSTGSTASNPDTRSQVPGFGCCFTGDNKTYPHRTYKAKYYSFHRYQRPGHSWGPSRSGSRSTLDDDDWWDEDKGCMCGEVQDDWRMRVAPYMWEGWPLPGLDKSDVERLRERLQKFDEIREELIEVQNEYRDKHSCPPLTVTEELSRDSQEWAEILAMKGYAQYSDSQSRGENILVIDIEDELSGRQVVETWYREGHNFNYKHPGWQRGTSNFTQMIWKATREVGVGIAKFPYADTYVVVAQYKPTGNNNAPGQFRRNVPVPCFDDVDKGTNSLTIYAGNQIKELEEDGESNIKIASKNQDIVQDIDVIVKEPADRDSILDVSYDEIEPVILDIHADDFTDNVEDDDDSLSECSFDNSADDILISFDDNQEEVFKEKLIGRHFLGKQIVEEMIRELTNERLLTDAASEQLNEFNEEPKQCDSGKLLSATFPIKEEEVDTNEEEEECGGDEEEEEEEEEGEEERARVGTKEGAVDEIFQYLANKTIVNNTISEELVEYDEEPRQRNSAKFLSFIRPKGEKEEVEKEENVIERNSGERDKEKEEKSGIERDGAEGVVIEEADMVRDLSNSRLLTDTVLEGLVAYDKEPRQRDSAKFLSATFTIEKNNEVNYEEDGGEEGEEANEDGEGGTALQEKENGSDKAGETQNDENEEDERKDTRNQMFYAEYDRKPICMPVDAVDESHTSMDVDEVGDNLGTKRLNKTFAVCVYVDSQSDTITDV